MDTITTSVAKDANTASTPVKVCMHVTDAAYPDYRIMREATALVEEGYDVSIVDILGESTRPAEEDIADVHMKHIRMPDLFVPTRFKPWFLVKSAWMIARGTLSLANTPTDVYHAHDVKALPACYIAARLRHKPLIFDSHEIPLDDPNIARWRRISALATNVLARMMPRCTGVITASPLYAREISREFNYPDVTSVLNFPAYREIPKSDRLRQHLGLGPDVRIALYQGNLQPNRSLDQLVNAAPFLDPNIVIVMMGRAVDTTRKQLDDLIALNGVADRVKIIPAVPYAELLDWTASANMGLTIFRPDYTRSIRYCLPNKLFEYLMAGLPVLSAQLDAIADVLKTYDVGRVVPSLEPTDIAAAINAMLADPVALARMSSNALTAAREDFRWEKEKHKLFQVYRNVLSTPTRLSVKVGMHVLGTASTDPRVMREATALIAAGCDVSIVDIEEKGNCPSEEDIRGVHMKHVMVPRAFFSTRFDKWAIFRVTQMFVRTTLRLLQMPVDVYHAHEVSGLMPSYIAACLRRKPIIFDAHEMPLFERPLSEFGPSRRLLRQLLVVLLAYIVPRCAGVITVSPPIVEELRRRYGLKDVVLIRNLPEYRAVQKNDRLREFLGLKPEVRIALYQGYLQPNRGLDRLVRAAAFLEPDTMIVMMGKNRKTTQAQLEALIASEGVENRVKIIPPVVYAELLDWTASADIGLNVASPDYSLNVRYFLPNKLFEYLLAGLPVLSSSLEAMVEVINGYDVGQILSSLEPADIGAAINSMLADPAALARMHDNALTAARQELYWEKESTKLIQLYQSIFHVAVNRGNSDTASEPVVSEAQVGGSL